MWEHLRDYLRHVDEDTKKEENWKMDETNKEGLNSSHIMKNKYTGKNRLGCFYNLSNNFLLNSSENQEFNNNSSSVSSPSSFTSLLANYSSSSNTNTCVPIAQTFFHSPSLSPLSLLPSPSLPPTFPSPFTPSFTPFSISSINFKYHLKDQIISNDLDIYDPFDNENMRI